MKHTIKHLPELEKPCERLEPQGVESLSDAEMLGKAPRTSIHGLNAREMCSNILLKHDFN